MLNQLAESQLTNDWEKEEITREIEFDDKKKTEVKHYNKLIEISRYELSDLTKL